MKDYSGVYVIECVSNGKKYVGSSLVVLKRMKEHRTALSKNKHRNKYLQFAYNKYGVESFSWKVLCKEPENRFVEEQSWIEKLRTANRRFGYNLAYPVRVNMPNPTASRKMKKKWKETKYRTVVEAALLEGSRKVSELYKTNPEFVAKMSDIRKNSWNDKNKQLVSSKAKKRYQNPDFKKGQGHNLAAGRKRLAELRKDPNFVANQVKGIVSRWTDPEVRKQQAKRMAALWDNPEFRAKQVKTASERIRAYNEKRAASVRDSLNNNEQ